MGREEMMFGVGTSDHQCEAHQDGCDDTWDLWERDNRLVERGRATDFWNRYPEDIGHARDFGCTAFRFSVSWTRVQPSREVFSDAALDHYDALTRAVVAAGMEPVVTLLHGAWPPYVDLAGPDFPELFAGFARRVATRLADRVRWWLTINEPDQFPYGYVKPWWAGEYRMPPGLPAGEEPGGYVRLVMRGLFLANALGRQAIKEVRPDAMVSANPFVLGLPGWFQRFLDWRTCRLRSEPAWDRKIRRAARPRGLGGGRVDLVVGASSATAWRGRHVDFSRPYDVAAMRLLVPSAGRLARAADSHEHLMEAIRGTVVAAVRGSTAASSAQTVLPGVTLLPVHGYPDALAELAAGRAGALLADDVILERLAASAEDGRWEVLRYGLSHERYVVAVANGNSSLLRVIDESLAGHHTPGRHVAPPGELGRIRRRGRLVAGVRPEMLGPAIHEGDRSTEKEIRIVRDLAGRIFGDPERATLEPLAVSDRVPALRPWWSRLLDQLLHPVDWLLCSLNTGWWHLGITGQLPEWLCPPGCAHQQDFVAVDYYWGIRTVTPRRLRELSHLTAGDYANAPVWPGAVGQVLRRAARWFPGQPIMLVENGCVDVASSTPRATYLREHLRKACAAAAAGVPLAGYICWSLTSNREWGLPFGPGSDFGLLHIDLDTDPALQRTATPAAREFRRLISEAQAGGAQPTPQFPTSTGTPAC